MCWLPCLNDWLWINRRLVSVLTENDLFWEINVKPIWMLTFYTEDSLGRSSGSTRTWVFKLFFSWKQNHSAQQNLPLLSGSEVGPAIASSQTAQPQANVLICMRKWRRKHRNRANQLSKFTTFFFSLPVLVFLKCIFNLLIFFLSLWCVIVVIH